MGRKDTLAAKSIRKMYEQLNLNQSDIFSKTKLLLSVYRDVVWITLRESARVNEELVYYGEELDSPLSTWSCLRRIPRSRSLRAVSVLYLRTSGWLT